MAIDFSKLRTEFSTLHTEATAVIEAAAADNRELKPDEKTANDTRFARMESIKTLIDENLRFASLALAGDPSVGGTVDRGTEVPGRAEFEASRDNGQPVIDFAKQGERAAFAKAVAQWAGTGEMSKRFATITTATQSGIFLPREIAASIVPTAANTFREAISIQGMDSVSLITTDTNASLKVPVVTGSAGGVVAENASAETENTPSLTESINLDTSTYQSGSYWFSNAVLAAGAVDLINGVIPTLRYEKELGLEAAITASLIADAGITQTVTMTGTTAAGLTYAKLVELNRKLPKRFDSKKVILLSDDAYTAAEQLTDSQGRPVLNQDTQNQELKRFNGTPVLRASSLESFGVSKICGVVISLLGFRLRDVSGENVTRYTQNSARPNQSGFNAFSYHGAGWAPSAVAKLKTSAS